MWLAVALVAAAAALAEGGDVEDMPFPSGNYHDAVGIPRMAAITKYEQELQAGGRIAGGDSVPAGTHPYLAGVVIHLAGVTWTSTCGASLLTHTKALTAAHCWDDGQRQAERFTMVYGSSFLNSGGVRIDTNQVAMHPEYNISIFAHDIAIVTHSWVNFDSLINRILLPSGSLLDRTYENEWAMASGFGLIAHGIRSENKREASLMVISNEECAQRWGDTVTEAVVCTSGAHGRNVCTGDSGGPLVVGSGPSRVLIGVVSFGGVICNGGHPAGYARVTHYVPWIVQGLIN